MARISMMNVAGWLYSIAIVLFLFLPVMIILPASFSDSTMLEFPPVSFTLVKYTNILSSDVWQQSASVSLRIALAAACLATLVGMLVALAQYRYSALSGWMRSFLMLPLIIPNIILASGLFPILLRIGGLGSEWILVITGTAISVPIVMITLVSAFDTLDPLLWTAASSLGARSLRIIGSILAPLVAISIVMSMLLAFHTVWDETTFAVFVGPIVSPPLTSKIYAYLQQSISPEIAAIASILLYITLIGSVLMFGLSKLAGKRNRFVDASTLSAASDTESPSVHPAPHS
ncbi:ABC transporter permease [Agrobacterium tumefaciens]|uniref:ABC transporter permease n=1 Tax=Agrobacterium tumefaciens TaxID=358 RepID=UPI001572BEE8|nr:ABC transporter permease subunit [Agrobacterium tumefaciens]